MLKQTHTDIWWPSRAHQQDREKIDCRVNLSWYVKPNWEGKKYPQHPEVYDWWRREVVSKLEFRWTCLKWRLCLFFLTSTNGKKISSEQIRHIIISYCHKLTFSSRRRTCIVLFIPLAADNQSSVPIHTIAILVLYSLYRGSIGREHSIKANSSVQNWQCILLLSWWEMMRHDGKRWVRLSHPVYWDPMAFWRQHRCQKILFVL